MPAPRKRSSKKTESTEPSLFSEADGKPAWVPPPLAEGWIEQLQDEFNQPYFQNLQAFLAQDRQEHKVYPPEEEVFTAFRLTPFEEVKVLILGQDPYHNPGEAHGLCFSVKPGMKVPPSLRNIFKELKDDIGCAIPAHGDLETWGKQGVFLLNAVMTVRENQPTSHKDKGWERFTDAVIRKVSAKEDRVVFVLWGAYAQKKTALIDLSRHTVLQSVHPSPLSAKNGFFGSKPFSQANAALKKAGRGEIDWEMV